MNLIGVLFCCLLLALTGLITKVLWEKNAGKPLCRLNIAIVATGALGLFGVMAVALLLGHTEQRGPYANLAGSFGVLSGLGVFLGALGNCGEKRKW